MRTRTRSLAATAATAVIAFAALAAGCGSSNDSASGAPSDAGSATVDVDVTGGHDLNPVDNGRPVVLIAAALDVPESVFRDAFSRVNPAPLDRGPTPEEELANKQALLATLAPYGVTNDRLDEVSNYYRYRNSYDERWPQNPAVVRAIVDGGAVVGFEVVDGGSGYTTPPTITVDGRTIDATVELSASEDFAANGRVVSVTLAT